MIKQVTRLIPMLGFVFILGACQEEQAELVEVKRPVRYQEVGYAGGAQVRTFSGTAQTGKVINLSFRSGGIVTKFDVTLGQAVKRNQLIGQLDNVSSRLAHEQAISSLNSATSQVNTAKLNLDRVRELYEKGSASLSDFESAKNGHRTAQASMESAERSVDIQKEQIRYGYIYAPEAGTIAAVNTEVNENVGVGQVVAVLNAGKEMEISLGLPEGVINNLSRGMKVDVSFTSLPGQVHPGKVSEVSPSLDPNTSTYPVRIVITDPTQDIRSGMAANVSFDFAGKDVMNDQLIVPAKAVGEDSDGRFVFLIEGSDSDARVTKRPVKIGKLSSEGFEIVEGLELGQKIATAGLQTLLDGQAVKLQ